MADDVFGVSLHETKIKQVVERGVEFWAVDSVLGGPPEDTDLCSVCAQIDFRFFHRNPIWSQYKPPELGPIEQEIPLRWLSSILDKQNKCKFCRLVEITLRLHYRSAASSVWQQGQLDGRSIYCSLYNETESSLPQRLRSVYIDEKDGKAICWTFIADKDRIIRRRRLQLSKERSKLDGRVYFFEIGTTPHIMDPLEPAAGDKSGLSRQGQTDSLPSIQVIQQDHLQGVTSVRRGGRLISQDQANFPLLSQWLKLCEHGHPELGGFTIQSELWRHGLRIIDIKEKCLVYLDRPSRYVALSYVWGMDQPVKLLKSNKTLLEKPGELLKRGNLSKTIVDAMVLLEKIDERYIWVDALCIIQDDEDDKMNLIRKMHLIYQCACLTVVAASGLDANAGISGIRSGSRTHQHVEGIQKLQMANMLPSWRGAVESSRWNSRAWTYQERLLSRRMLVFTEDQAHYQCADGCSFKEEEVTESEYLLSNKIPRQIEGPGAKRPLVDFEEETNLEVYARLVKEYTSRQMTSPHDHLNAFLSVEQVILPLFRAENHGFVAGLPPAIFDVALLWMPLNRSLRRKDHKTGKVIGYSWSWSGWEGVVDYEPTLNRCETTISLLRFLPWDDSQEAKLAESTIKGKSNDIDLGELKQVLNESNWERSFDEESGGVYYVDREKDSDIRFASPILASGKGTPVLEYLNHLCKALEAQKILGLKFQAPVASFRIDGSHTRGMTRLLATPCKGDKHSICPLSVFDAEASIAGTVYVDAGIAGSLQTGQYDFVALSQTTLFQIDLDVTWDKDAYTFLRSPEQRHGDVSESDSDDDSSESFDDVSPARLGFDPRKYNKNAYWPLYNVLLIETRDAIAYRIGIGRIHVDAFKPIAKTQTIILG